MPNVTTEDAKVNTGSETKDGVLASDVLSNDILAAAALFDDSIDSYSSSSSAALTKMTPRLFGLPYQFAKTVDPRIYSKTNWEESLNSNFGRHFLSYFLIGAPILTVIPGKPKYNKAVSLEQIMLSQAGGDTDANGNFAKVLNFNREKNNEKRFYAFEQDYKNYFTYVNVLCRTCAIFMEIGNVTGPGMTVPYASYDWKNYRMDGSTYKDTQVSTIKKLKSWALMKIVGGIEKVPATAFQVAGWLEGFGKELKSEVLSTVSDAYNAANYIFDFNKASESSISDDTSEDTVTETSTEQGSEINETDQGSSVGSDTNGGVVESLIDYNNIEELLCQRNFIQFYIDPTTSNVSEQMTNSVGESKFESIQSSFSDLAKEVGFLMQSGGVDSSTEAIAQYINEGFDALSDALAGSSTLTNVFSTILGTFNNSLKGESVVFPKIWQRNEFSKSYTVKIKLRSVYGHRESYYLDVMVPLMHILAMALPKQTTSNAYGSPFIHKMYYPGVFSCNMGIITSLDIDKHQGDGSWTIDGFPNEVDVTMQISDLYADLPITSGNDPDLFANNDSLLAYLGTLCGIDYTAPDIATRQSAYLTASRNTGSELGAQSTINRMVDQFVTNLVDDTVSYYTIA